MLSYGCTPESAVLIKQTVWMCFLMHTLYILIHLTMFETVFVTFRCSAFNTRLNKGSCVQNDEKFKNRYLSPQSMFWAISTNQPLRLSAPFVRAGHLCLPLSLPCSMRSPSSSCCRDIEMLSPCQSSSQTKDQKRIKTEGERKKKREKGMEGEGERLARTWALGVATSFSFGVSLYLYFVSILLDLIRFYFISKHVNFLLSPTRWMLCGLLMK